NSKGGCNMWDKEKAVQYLTSHANVTSLGRCAEYTRKAIEAGGLVLIRHISAKDYGLSLRSVGFLPLGYDPRVYLPGDIVIIDGFEGHPHGHMAMFNGNSWISDFKQRELYPGPAFRKHRPHYTMFRYGILWDSAKPPLASNIA